MNRPSGSQSAARKNLEEVLETLRGQKRTMNFAYGMNSKSTSPQPKKRKAPDFVHPPLFSLNDIRGIDKISDEISKLLIHTFYPVMHEELGIVPSNGILLHGPPGCGKTLLVNTIAEELNIPILRVIAPNLCREASNGVENKIIELFVNARAWGHCIILINQIDAITPNCQSVQNDPKERALAQLISEIDTLLTYDARIFIIAETNRPPHCVDPALRRAGRLDKEFCIGIPNVDAKVKILKVLTSKLKLSEGFNYEVIAKSTPGFVGADLMVLTREAAMRAKEKLFNDMKKSQLEAELIRKNRLEEELQKSTDTNNSASSSDGDDEIEVTKENVLVIINDESDTYDVVTEKILLASMKEKIEDPPLRTESQELASWLRNERDSAKEQFSNLIITMDDFRAAQKLVKPFANKGFPTVPNVTWNDVGSLRDVREELKMAVLAPIKHTEQFKGLGLTTPTGVLLCGPSGCGKKLLAKATANEAKINFISLDGPKLLNMYIEEGDKAITLYFERARDFAPCIIFFDKLDVLCPNMLHTNGEVNITTKLINQIITQMDEMEKGIGVYFLAATDRPDMIDQKLLGRGRLDKIIYVGLPSDKDRVDILRTITKHGTKPQLAPDVNLNTIGRSQQCIGYTAADLVALVKEAGVHALKDYMAQDNQEPMVVVTTDHFARALAELKPAMSEKSRRAMRHSLQYRLQ